MAATQILLSDPISIAENDSKYADSLYKQILASFSTPSASQDSLMHAHSFRQRETALLKLGQLYRNQQNAEGVAQVVQLYGTLMASMTESKTADLIRTLSDYSSAVSNSHQTEISLLTENMTWADREKYKSFKHTLGLALNDLELKANEYRPVCTLVDSLLNELKKRDGRLLPTELRCAGHPLPCSTSFLSPTTAKSFNSRKTGSPHEYLAPFPSPPSAPRSPLSIASSTPHSDSSSVIDNPTDARTVSRPATHSRSSSNAPQPGSGARTRSRSGSTMSRNAVYISSAVDSQEVERRLLDLTTAGSERDRVDDGKMPTGDSEHLEGLPASPDLRTFAPRKSFDSPESFAWGFPKPPNRPGVHAPPSTPRSPPPSSPRCVGSPRAQKVEKSSPKRSNSTSGSSAATSIPTTLSSPSRHVSQKSQDYSLLTIRDERHRLADPRTRSAYTSTRPILASPASVPLFSLSPSKPRVTRRRPAPLDLSRKSKSSLNSTSATDSGSTTGASEPVTPAYSTAATSWDDLEPDCEIEIATEDEMDPELVAVAAGLNVPSIPRHPSSPLLTLSSESAVCAGRARANPTALSGYSLYCDQSPEKHVAPGTHRPTDGTQSATYLPSLHSLDASVPRGATPTIRESQSLISPGDLPPSIKKRTRKLSTATMTSALGISGSRSPPSSPTSTRSPGLTTKRPKVKGGGMSGLMSRFSFGSSNSLATLSAHHATLVPVPPVPALNVDELGHVTVDPFSKEDTSTILEEPERTRFMDSAKSDANSMVFPTELSFENVMTWGDCGGGRSDTTATATSAFSTSTIDSITSESSPEPLSLDTTGKKHRLLRLTFGALRSPTSPVGRGKGKNRKLVVTGMDADDVGAYEAVKGWCENFGEVRKIERQDNGSLVIDWKKKNVTDMVCRVQASAFIIGAGSVALSWY